MPKNQPVPGVPQVGAHILAQSGEVPLMHDRRRHRQRSEGGQKPHCERTRQRFKLQHWSTKAVVAVPEGPSTIGGVLKCERLNPLGAAAGARLPKSLQNFWSASAPSRFQSLVPKRRASGTHGSPEETALSTLTLALPPDRQPKTQATPSSGCKS